MKNKVFVLKAISAATLALAAGATSAHVGYGTPLYDGTTNTYAGTDSNNDGVWTSAATVSSNAGWISAMSNNGVNRTPTVDTLADSHNNRFRWFTLTAPSQVSFTITGLTNPSWVLIPPGTTTPVNGVTGAISGCTATHSCPSGYTENPNLAGFTPSTLNPGFSLFRGTVPASSHDGAGDQNGLTATQITTLNSPAMLSYLGNQPAFATWSPFFDTMDEITANGGGAFDAGGANWGVYRGDGDVTMGNNNGVVSTMFYTGISAGDGWNGDPLDNSINWSGILLPGTYSLVIGGASQSELTALFAEVQNGTGNPAAGFSACDTGNPVSCNGTAYSDAYAQLRMTRNMNIDFKVQAVPIPAAVWLFGSALAGMGVIGRRRQAVA